MRYLNKIYTGLFFFFFSSRRRHTRSLCDWSSDVCSSDLLYSSTSPRGLILMRETNTSVSSVSNVSSQIPFLFMALGCESKTHRKLKKWECGSFSALQPTFFSLERHSPKDQLISVMACY